MKDKVKLKLEKETKNITTAYKLEKKLIIVVPKSGLTENVLAGFDKGCLNTDASSSDGPRSYQFNVYKVNLGDGSMVNIIFLCLQFDHVKYLNNLHAIKQERASHTTFFWYIFC